MGVREYAIELLFAKPSEATVLELFAQLKEAGFGLPDRVLDYHPHITLNVCQVLDLEGLEHYIQGFCQRTRAFGLELSYLGAFPASKSVLFLGPTIKQRLFNLHKVFLKGARPFIKATRSYYEPDNWVPHCTLAFDLNPADLNQALATISQTPLPIAVNLAQLALVEVPKGQMLYSYPLQQTSL